MEFIGTEVGIKIRLAIKAKLTELGKTVDDELIDYIMVMVANKKEENQMARDLQPFLESDTVKFTSWLHVVLQKLEQVTVIVTDDEFKIATSAFGKIGKKRKSSESNTSTSKKKSSKEEPKTKKKKSVKHDHSKHGKTTIVSTEVSKTQVTSKDNAAVTSEKTVKSKSHVSSNLTAGNNAKPVKIKKSKPVTAVSAPNQPVVKKVSGGGVKKVSPVAASKSNVTKPSNINHVEPSEQNKKPNSAESEPIKVDSVTKSPNTVRAVIPVQRPVMMQSDDDDDDDDFINIKTDMAEEDDLLEEEKVQRPAVAEVVEEPPTTRTVHLDAAKPDIVKPKVDEDTVRQALVPPENAPVTLMSAAVVPSPKRSLKRQATSPPPRPRPPIMSRVGAVLKRKASHLSDEEEEEGEGEVKNGSVASVVKVKPRPKLPPAAQAPKNLLLKAMADAQRSVATAPVREVQPSSAPPRSPLFTRKFRDRQQERIAITLPNVRDSASETEAEVKSDKEDEEQDEAYVPEVVTSPSLPPDVVYSPSPIVKAATKPLVKQVVRMESRPPVKRRKNTEFVVTLDGYDTFPEVTRTVVCSVAPEQHKASHSEEDEDLEEEEGVEERVEEQEPEEEKKVEISQKKPVRQKIVFTTKPDTDGDSISESKIMVPPKSLDRCRFWPACRVGDACTFHHPSQPCKSFPNCQFGDRCLYVHPNCKFDSSCTRKDCPFTHTSPRVIVPAAVIAPVPRPITQRLGAGPICRFFPNCTNTNCRFYHPKPCRYGRQCSKVDCSFSHTEFPPKEKMKWVNSMSVL